MLRAIVLDFDGVIADTEPLHFRAFREVVAAEGIELTESAYYDRYLGYNDVRAFEAIGADHGRTWATGVAGLVERKARVLEDLEARTSVLFPGAEAFIRRAAAVVPLAIASGALREEIERVLDRTGLAPCFSVIVGAQDANASKPSPDPYCRAVELLGRNRQPPLRPRECVAIEDSRWGIESARAAGLRTVGVTHSYDAAALSEADLVVPSLGVLNLTDLQQLV